MPGWHLTSHARRSNRIILADLDARLMKTPQGIMPGFNAQAMIYSVASGVGMTDMLVTAADLVDETTDHGLLIPMMEQAEAATGTKAAMSLADSGYFAGSSLEECAKRGQDVVVPERRQWHLLLSSDFVPLFQALVNRYP